ncbi:phosphoglycerate kinase, partial [bacterium]|nr:phosphoglycerate kinase [bacterium]
GKIEVIKNLLPKVDALLVGGGMTYAFFKAQGYEIGNSLMEEGTLEVADEVLTYAADMPTEFLLPVDSIAADKFDASANVKTVPGETLESGWMGLDIGPKTIEIYRQKILNAKTIIWNGPMGVFEMEPFAAGTKAIANALVEATARGAVTIIGGGDSAAAIKQFGWEEKVSHVSTGGGASLEYLEGKVLPGVAALTEV